MSYVYKIRNCEGLITHCLGKYDNMSQVLKINMTKPRGIMLDLGDLILRNSYAV